MRAFRTLIILLMLLCLVPPLGLLVAGLIARWAGCELDLPPNTPLPCTILGGDYGNVLFALAEFGWYAVETISRFRGAADGMAYYRNREGDGTAAQAASAPGSFFLAEVAAASGGFEAASASSGFPESCARIVRPLRRPVLHEAFQIAVDDSRQHDLQRDELIAMGA